jgi:hypothetical protein
LKDKKVIVNGRGFEISEEIIVWAEEFTMEGKKWQRQESQFVENFQTHGGTNANAWRVFMG